MINSILEKAAQSFRFPKYRCAWAPNSFFPMLRVRCGFYTIFWIGIQFNETKKKYRICYGIRYVFCLFVFPSFSLIYQPFPFDLISSMAAHWYRFILRGRKQKQWENTSDFSPARKTWRQQQMNHIQPRVQVFWFWQEMLWLFGHTESCVHAMEIFGTQENGTVRRNKGATVITLMT